MIALTISIFSKLIECPTHPKKKQKEVRPVAYYGLCVRLGIMQISRSFVKKVTQKINAVFQN